MSHDADERRGMDYDNTYHCYVGGFTLLCHAAQHAGTHGCAPHHTTPYPAFGAKQGGTSRTTSEIMDIILKGVLSVCKFIGYKTCGKVAGLYVGM